MGVVLSVSSYLLDQKLYGIWLSKRRSFRLTFFLTIFKFFVWSIIYGGVFIGVLHANKSVHSNFHSDLYWMDGMFNVFLFIVGSSMIMISVVVNCIAELIMSRKNKKEEINANI